MILKSERLVLRLINKNDIEWLRNIRNKYRDNFFDNSIITMEQQRAWYDRYVANEGRDQMFVIQLKSGEQIGTLALYNISISDRTADVGRFLLLDEYRHKGYAEEAMKTLINYALNVVKLYKLRVSVYLDNLDAIAIYARAGFTHKRPIILLERTNHSLNWKEPLQILTADDYNLETEEP